MAKTGPEAWRAQVLRDEAEQLTAAVRLLENRAGWFEGWDAGVHIGHEGAA